MSRPNSQAKVQQENKRTVQSAFEALMAGDLSPLGQLLAPDAVLHQCGFLQPLPARAILQGGFPGPRSLSEREVRLEHMIAEGDLVALHWRTTGRFSDPDSPELDGKRVGFPSMTFVRLQDGKIAEIWNIQDRETLRSALYEGAHEEASA